MKNIEMNAFRHPYGLIEDPAYQSRFIILLLPLFSSAYGLLIVLHGRL